VPDPLPGRYDDLAVGLLFGAAALLAGVAAWAWRRAARGGVAATLAGLAPAAAGAGALAAAGGFPPGREPGLTPVVAGAAAVAAGALLADFDRRRRDGLALPLLAVSVAGVWATVPDVESAMVVLGAALPPALLGWPSPLARSGLVSLGVAGSLASAGLLVWVVAGDGAGRPGSMVGGLACLGMLGVEPVARRLVGRRPGDRRPGGPPLPALPVAAAHLALVAVAARVVGRRETVAEALPLALLELAVALAVTVAALRRVAAAHTPN
jgi:hypothetical protein